MTEQISTLILSELKEIKSIISSHDTEIKEIKFHMLSMHKYMDDKFAKIDSRFENIDRKFEAIEKRLSHIEQRQAN